MLLRKKTYLALDDLAKELNISKPAVLKHINKLESQGIVERRFIVKGRGRPRCYIKLSDYADELFPKNYEEWAIDIIKYAEDKLGREKVLEFLKSKMQDNLNKYNLYILTERNIRAKVSRLVDIMNKEGYIPELREGKDYIEIIKYNCPIMKIAKSYPEICSFEADMFTKMLDKRVELVTSMVNNGSSCIIRIYKN